MKHYIYLLLILLIDGDPLKAAPKIEVKPTAEVILEGRVLDLPAQGAKQKITVTVHIATFAANITTAPTTKYVVEADSNNYFKLVIAAPAKRFYMHLSFAPNGNAFIDHIYLLEQGDKLKCTLSKGNFSFSGKGSAKLNCQSQIYQARYRATNATLAKAKNGVWAEVFEAAASQQDSILQVRLAIVESFAPLLGKDMANIMRANCYGLSYFTMLRTERIASLVPGRFTAFINSTAFKKLPHVALIDTVALLASPNYTDFLFEQLLMTNMSKNDGKLIRNAANLMQIYSQIKQGYSGLLGEKLMVLFFLNFKENAPLDGFFIDALQHLHHPEYRALVLDVQKKKMRGQPFYPFEMEDEKGNLVKLSDFKDKVVLIDFWFTGCGACKLLNTAMAPVVSQFRDQPRVKFLSVSIDADKNRWLSSIQSGAYTHKESINLYAGGQSSSSGNLHPLIKAYDVSVFPTMFLLRDNKIVELTPPRPSATDHQDPQGGNTMKLIQLINKALNDGG